MSLVKRNHGLFPAFDVLFNDFFNERHETPFLPAVNIKESGDAFTLEVSAPGRNKEDFKIELNNNQLTLSAENKEERSETDDTGKFTRREFRLSSFKRSFTLPHTVANDKIEANYENGVLTLSLPKREEAKAKPARLIEIG